MNASSRCTECFTRHERPDCRLHTGSTSALIDYTRLHNAGFSSFMCQKHDGHFRVCHLPDEAAAVPVELMRGAA